MPPGDLAAAVPGLLGRGFQPYRAFHRGDDGLADRVRDNPFEVLPRIARQWVRRWPRLAGAAPGRKHRVERDDQCPLLAQSCGSELRDGDGVGAPPALRPVTWWDFLSSRWDAVDYRTNET